jgi:hypothetical protein
LRRFGERKRIPVRIKEVRAAVTEVRRARTTPSPAEKPSEADQRE